MTTVRSQILASRPSSRRSTATWSAPEVGRLAEADPAEAHPRRVHLAAAGRAAGVAEARAPEARASPVDQAAARVDEAVRGEVRREGRRRVERRGDVDHAAHA